MIIHNKCLQLYEIQNDFGKNGKNRFYHCPGKNRFLPANANPGRLSGINRLPKVIIL